jgi:signal transduction histidine kinase
MLERALLLGSELHIESAPGEGAKVWLEARVAG